MDILFNLECSDYQHTKKILLSPNLDDLINNPDCYTFTIVENGTYTLNFSSVDRNARLYIEGIDNVENSQYDIDMDLYYILPQSEPFTWLRWDKTDKPCIPGSYYIKLNMQNEMYYGILKIQPRHLNECQLQQMKDDVEIFLQKWTKLPRGAKERIQNNYSYYQENEKKQIELIIDSYEKIIPILQELAHSPKERLEKVYQHFNQNSSQKVDQIAIKMTLKKNCDWHKTYGYSKNITYSTQENKWLKYFNEKLYSLIQKLKLLHISQNDRNIFQKLEKACLQLRNCEWYKNLSVKLHEILPSQSQYDSRYTILFKFYTQLYKSSNSSTLTRTKEYLWLQTSWVYELWCFQKVYKILIEEQGYQEIASTKFGFVLNNSNITLKLYYDTPLPLHISQTHELLCPLYARTSHRTPDSRIDIYKENKYHGSIILEFKYSKYYNVWNIDRQTRCSEQLLHYGYQLASPYLTTNYNLPEHLLKQLNPIKKLFVVTPNLFEDRDLIEDVETNIVQLRLNFPLQCFE